MTDSPVAYVGIMVGAGTRDEDTEENGMAHYIEHCVFKGTEKRNARQIISQIEGIGGEVNAYTTKEETTFYAATPVEHLRHTFNLIADMVLHPTFPKKETDKEMSVILDEIESYNDSPSELIYDDFEGLVFEGSSLSMPILGTKKTLKHISRNATTAQEWMKRYYRPDRMVVFVLGKANPKSIVTMVEKAIADKTWENNGERPTHDVHTTHGRSIQYKKHTHQTHVMIGAPAYALGHDKQLGMYLLNNILGGGSLNSKLNMSLRERRGLVYTVESTYTPLSDTGYWSIYFASDAKDKEQCMELVEKELRALREQPMSSAQLQRALTQLKGQMAISAENQENNALGMAKQMLYYGEAPSWQESYEKIKQFSPRDLLEIANESFDEKNICRLSYE